MDPKLKASLAGIAAQARTEIKRLTEDSGRHYGALQKNAADYELAKAKLAWTQELEAGLAEGDESKAVRAGAMLERGRNAGPQHRRDADQSLLGAIVSNHESVGRSQKHRVARTVQHQIADAETKASKLQIELRQLSAKAPPLAARLRAASARLAARQRRIVAPPTRKSPTITPQKRAAVFAPDLKKSSFPK